MSVGELWEGGSLLAALEGGDPVDPTPSPDGILRVGEIQIQEY